MSVSHKSILLESMAQHPVGILVRACIIVIVIGVGIERCDTSDTGT